MNLTVKLIILKWVSATESDENKLGYMFSLQTHSYLTMFPKKTMMALYRSLEQTDLHTYC